MEIFRKKRGFTLVEILGVMAIIMVLAGMVMVVSKAALTKAKKSKAEAMISALSVAVSMFYTDTGQYPNIYALTVYPASEADIINANEELRYHLSEDAIAPQYPGWRGPYIELKESELRNLGHGAYAEIIDPWGKAYAFCSKRYSVSILHNKNSFDIYSAGPNGIYGDSDDITNW